MHNKTVTMLSPEDPRLDGIVTFLAVARRGRFTAAAEALGVNHSTVSRRIAALEGALGGRLLDPTPGGWELTALGRQTLGVAERIETALLSLTKDAQDALLAGIVRVAAPDGFTTAFAVPAFARLAREHVGVSFELVSATQPIRRTRTGVDIEVVIGKPHVHRAAAYHVADYALRLYASRTYLETHGGPESVDELVDHRISFYIESALKVDELDKALDGLPAAKPGLMSTSVFAHVRATAESAGIGILPDFLADQEPNLVRVVESYRYPLSYWAVVREETVGNPVVVAALEALFSYTREVKAIRAGSASSG